VNWINIGSAIVVFGAIAMMGWLAFREPSPERDEHEDGNGP
jgi:hypothetical protein